MGAFADSLFAVLMSWVRALVNSIWALFTTDKTTALEFLGKHWLTIVIVLIAAGLIVDWVTWMIRWKPYALRGRMREAQRRDEEKEIERRAKDMFRETPDELERIDDDLLDGDDDWLPERPGVTEEEAQRAMTRAQEVPDAELGAYPGMRYDENAQPIETKLDGTRRYAAVHQEGPGAAEVARRREEIDAWQRMQEEEHQRLLQREEERKRQMIEKERERQQAQEERRQQRPREEEARVEDAAQREYQRQMAEYERQKAQYEQEMAQYQRDLAAYEAAMAQGESDAETAHEIAPETTPRSRTRRRAATYSDMVQGETVESLPQTPAWPRMEETVSAVKKSAEPKKKPAKTNGFVGKMAHLIEPEQEEIAGVHALPPRVDPHQAYKPAAQPEDRQQRRRK